MKNGDMPAMPCQPLGQDGMPSWEMTYGLTKREMFAMAAMQGLLANSAMIDTVTDGSLLFISESSVVCADALLNALEVNHANDQL